MNGIRGKITVNGQPIDEYAKEQQEKDFMEHMNRQLFEIHHEIEETQEAFIYKVFDDHLRDTGRGSFSKADLYRAVYLLEEERAGRLVYPWNRWIPVTERLPEELVPVNITWVNHNPESYYKHITDKPFTATGVYFNGQWYWWSTLCTDMLAEYGRNYSDMIDDDVEITAWMPLPKPYEEGAEE